MNQTAPVQQGPIAVPQPQTPTEQYLYQRMNQLENVVAGIAQHDIRTMSPGRIALVVGSAVVAMGAVGIGSAAIYDRAKYGRSNQPKQVK